MISVHPSSECVFPLSPVTYATLASVPCLVGKLGLVAGMATQQGVSFGCTPPSLMLKEKRVLELSLQLPAWYSQCQGCVLFFEDCNLSPISSF